jgi:hypothetical protein
MRILLLIAVILFAVALVSAAVPTVVAGVSAIGWIAAGLLVWSIDVLLGSPAVALGTRRV